MSREIPSSFNTHNTMNYIPFVDSDETFGTNKNDEILANTKLDPMSFKVIVWIKPSSLKMHHIIDDTLIEIRKRWNHPTTLSGLIFVQRCIV